MRSYMIEEMDAGLLQALAEYLQNHGYQGPIDDIYWFQMPWQALSHMQQDHLQQCGPYIVSLELGRDWLKLELVVRAVNSFRCNCTAQADSRQRDYSIALLENILTEVED